MRRLFILLGVLSLLFFSQNLPQSFASASNGVEDESYYYLQTDHFKIAFSGKYWQQYLKDDNITTRRLRDEHKPEMARQVGEWAEEAWVGLIDEMGFLPPVAYATGNYVIVLQEFQPSHLGITIPSEQLADETETVIGVNITSTENDIKTTLVHELFHLIQFGYDPFRDLRYAAKMAEGTAVWVEDEVLDEINSYTRFFDQSFFGISEDSLFGSRGEIDAPDSISRYGNFLWYRFLSEKHGQQIVREFWEEYSRLSKAQLIKREPLLYADYLSQKNILENIYNTTLAEEYHDFAIQNLDSQFYDEGTVHPQVDPVLTVKNFPYKSGQSVNNNAPHLFGSHLIQFETSGEEGSLIVDFQGSDDARFSLSLVPMDGLDALLEKASTVTSEYGEALQLQVDINGYQEFSLMISVVESNADLSDKEYDAFTSILYGYQFVASIENALQAVPRPELIITQADEQLQSSDSSPERRQRRTAVRRIFSDLSEKHPYAVAIEKLKNDQVIKGYSDGSFKPEQAVNRAEFVKIIIEAAFKQDLGGGQCFPDVDSSLWFAAYVCTAANKGIVGGFPDGTFGPTQNITVAAAYKVVLEAFVGGTNIPERDGHWYLKYTEYAKSKGISHEADFDPTLPITRAQMAQLMYLVTGREGN